jgi:hypothetical protein
MTQNQATFVCLINQENRSTYQKILLFAILIKEEEAGEPYQIQTSLVI